VIIKGFSFGLWFVIMFLHLGAGLALYLALELANPQLDLKVLLGISVVGIMSSFIRCFNIARS